MVKPRKKSKRVPVRLRHKIEKRSNEKARKERRDIKKHPELHRKKRRDKLSIPNSFPYKDRLLSEIEEGKRLKEEEQMRRRDAAKQRKKELVGGGEEVMEDLDEPEESSDSGNDLMDEDEDEDTPGTGNSAMAALLASARARAAEFEAEHGDSSGESDDAVSDSESSIPDMGPPSTRKDTSRKSFDKMFKQVVDAADVVLYVLDARDPEGTRSREVERQVMAADGGGKRLILILNKIDLVPPNVLRGWMRYLRRYFPTLPLRASGSAANAQAFDHKALTVKATSAALLRALKSFAHSKQLKRSVSVGVIGYPNVGKSSVINALTGRLGGSQTACPTGAEAGVTTTLREVKLDKKLKLLDSPGIVFPSNNNDGSMGDQAHLILLNAVPPKQILDPVPAVSLLIRRLSTSETLFNKLLDLYNLPPLVSTRTADITMDFLVQVARKRGRLGKGGIPNVEAAAKAVIMDWRDGRIQGWVDPPAPVLGATGHGVKPVTPAPTADDQKEIVKEWAEEFKLDGLWGDDWLNSEGDRMDVEP